MDIDDISLSYVPYYISSCGNVFERSLKSFDDFVVIRFIDNNNRIELKGEARCLTDVGEICRSIMEKRYMTFNKKMEILDYYSIIDYWGLDFESSV